MDSANQAITKILKVLSYCVFSSHILTYFYEGANQRRLTFGLEATTLAYQQRGHGNGFLLFKSNLKNIF